MTDLFSAIHARWTAAGLAALAPLTTGPARGPALPAASLLHTAGRSLALTNATGRFEEIELELRLWHGDFDVGLAIAELLLATFDRAAFDTAGGRVLAMRRTDEHARHQADGAWEFFFRFLVHLFQEAA